MALSESGSDSGRGGVRLIGKNGGNFTYFDEGCSGQHATFESETLCLVENCASILGQIASCGPNTRHDQMALD